MIDYIKSRIEQLKTQLSEPECNDPKRVESKLDAYEEMLAYHKASAPEEGTDSKSNIDVLHTLNDKLVDLCEYDEDDTEFERPYLKFDVVHKAINEAVTNIEEHDLKTLINEFRDKVEAMEVQDYANRTAIPEVWKNTILLWFASVNYKVNGLPEPKEELDDPRKVEERALALYPYKESIDGFTGEKRDLNKEKRKSYIYFETKRLEDNDGQST